MDQGSWDFVRNRTKAIQEKGYLKWHHVPTSDNPSDQGSRGAEPRKLGELWFKGPSWLSNSDKWPQQPEVLMTYEVEKECLKPRPEKQLLAKKEEKNLIVDQLLHKYASYWKLLRVTAFVTRFIDNCKNTEAEEAITNRRIPSSREVLDYPGTGISSCKVRCEPEEGRRWNTEMCGPSPRLSPSLPTPRLQASFLNDSASP